MTHNRNLGMLGALIAFFAIGVPASFANDGLTTPTPSIDRQAVMEAYSQRPLSFERNMGQADPRVEFVSRGPGYNVFLTGSEAVLAMQEQPAAERSQPATIPAAEHANSGKSAVLRMALVGANQNPQVVALEELPGRSNYLLGNDNRTWRTGISTFAKVKYQGVYPGVDLVYYGNQRQLEYDFVIAPGADPSPIRLSFEGAKQLRVDASTGDLLITTENGLEMRHARPNVYQQVGKQRVEVAGSYHVLNGNQAAFTLASYDRQRSLVIDPTVSFTVFLAGNSQDVANAVAVDGSGNAYVTGYTLSPNFPRVGESNGYEGSYDAFVTKLSPTGAILYSTYWGGTGVDAGTGIAVDSTGVFVTGYTSSSNFQGQRIGSLSSGFHAFVTKLQLTGGIPIYSLELSGSSYDEANAIALDSSHNAYITGITSSTDFPMIGSWQTSNHGGYDAFVAKVDANGNLVKSAYIGGSSSDWANGIAVDASGDVWITGETFSADFPHTMPITLIPGGNTFVSEINSTFTGFWYSTEFGGGASSGTAITVDATGYAYVAGNVGYNTYFPTTPGTFQTARPSLSGDSAFVTKLDPLGGMMYSTYLGGSNGSTDATAITVHGNGIYVAGRTSSTTFPGAPVLTPNPTAGWVVKFTPQLNALDYTTFLGASINGIAVYQSSFLGRLTDPQIYTVGMRYTGSLAYQAEDAFVVKLDEPLPPPVLAQ